MSLSPARAAAAQTPYVGRLAPSPTGALHQGIARTFLGAWLDARAHDGRLILRVEDVDRARSIPEAYSAIPRDLEWLGLDWDVGPGDAGEGAPFVQSERSHRYAEALDRLTAQGRTFACTCSRREIREASAPHGPSDDGPRYPGTCRTGAAPRQGRAQATRFRVNAEPIEVVDRLLGPLRTNLEAEVGDFVLRRSDGLWAYQLAVTVDDLDQGVTCVVRGADLLSSSPRQAALRNLLDPTAPSLEWLHLPLVRTPEGERLSKRNGAVPIAHYRAQGVRPEAVVGGLAATLNLVPPGTEVAPPELVSLWKDAALPRADGVIPA